MKKKLAALVFSVTVLSAGLTGCNYAETEKIYNSEGENIKSMFIKVEETSAWTIVYDKETKVMYAVSSFSYGTGRFTLLVNADGTPKLWDGE